MLWQPAGCNISFNLFKATTGSIAAIAAGTPTVLPVGVSIWGAVHDRFTPEDYYPTATHITIEVQ